MNFPHSALVYVTRIQAHSLMSFHTVDSWIFTVMPFQHQLGRKQRSPMMRKELNEFLLLPLVCLELSLFAHSLLSGKGALYNDDNVGTIRDSGCSDLHISRMLRAMGIRVSLRRSVRVSACATTLCQQMRIRAATCVRFCWIRYRPHTSYHHTTSMYTTSTRVHSGRTYLDRSDG